MKVNHCLVTDQRLVTEFPIGTQQVLSPVDQITERACDKAHQLTLAHQSRVMDNDPEHNAKQLSLLRKQIAF